LAGVRSDLSHHFLHWGSKHASEIAKTLKLDASLGRSSLITLEPWPWALLETQDQEKFKRQEKEGNERLLTRIPSGLYDHEIISSLREIQKVSGRTVYVRLMHEMDITGQYPWSPRQPLDFIRSYRHIVNLSREMGIRNIRWVWSPAGDRKAADFWPGADYVDQIGLSIYATREWPSTTSQPGQIPSLASLLSDKLWVSKYGKPILLAEVGVNGSEEEKMAWLRESTEHLISSPSVWAWVYFDAKQPKFMPTKIGLPDWSLSQEQARYLQVLLSSAEDKKFSGESR
jgi:beta-mannanase